MTESPVTKQEPADHEPTTCAICQRRAIGLGLYGKSETRWLCRECGMLAEQIQSIRRMDIYEIKALDGGVDAVGEYLGQIGKYDLSEFDELERTMMIKAAVLGYGKRLRELIKEGSAPF